ncbi:hypothetical protein [Aliiroseovarius crassostreae]|uniref:hypothetical protein n=1 Tax=Aliiroseovarius crassostreae TaxID=154981 RepID=UPI003C7E01FD
MDLIAIDDTVGHFAAQESGWTDWLVPTNPPMSGKHSHFGLSKSSGADQFLSAFNAALADLRRSGALRTIQNSKDYDLTR